MYNPDIWHTMIRYCSNYSNARMANIGVINGICVSIFSYTYHKRIMRKFLIIKQFSRTICNISFNNSNIATYIRYSNGYQLIAIDYGPFDYSEYGYNMYPVILISRNIKLYFITDRLSIFLVYGDDEKIIEKYDMCEYINIFIILIKRFNTIIKK